MERSPHSAVVCRGFLCGWSESQRHLASQLAINISLTLDDSDSFGLVSFKSGVGELAFGGSGVQCRDLSGYLAVLRRGMAFSSKAFSQDDEADYSRDAGKRGPWALAHRTVPKAMCRRPGSGARHLQERPPYSRGWNNGCVKLLTSTRKRSRLATPWSRIFQNPEKWLANLEQVLWRSGVQGYVDKIAKTLQHIGDCAARVCPPAYDGNVIGLHGERRACIGSTRARVRRRLQELPNHVLTAGLSASASLGCSTQPNKRIF